MRFFFREHLSDPAHRLSANEQTNGAWLLAGCATSFQPRGCRGICVYCCIGDRLCGLSRILAILRTSRRLTEIWVCIAKRLERPCLSGRVLFLSLTPTHAPRTAKRRQMG